MLKILVLSGNYLPGYKGGGPIKTLKNLFDNLSGETFLFELITRDREHGDSEPYTNIISGNWYKVGNVNVMYLANGVRAYIKILKAVQNTKYDIIYCNSFFSPTFSIWPQILSIFFSRSLIVAPRGEFSSGALGLKSLKKIFYIKVYKFFRLHKSIIFQASTNFEAVDIRATLGDNVDVRVAENVSSSNFAKSIPIRKNSIAKAVVVCRISPMKNILGALMLLKDVRYPLIYDIYGPLEDTVYWGKCLKIIDSLPSHISVNYKGVINPENVISVIKEYDFFFMPTLGENFGHVLVEAFSAGLPVVISDRTPWRNLERKGVGWDVSLDNSEKFIRILERCTRIDSTKYYESRQKILDWAKEEFGQNRSVLANTDMFLYAYSKERK